MSKPDPNPRKVFGHREFNNMSHHKKVAYLRVAKRQNAVLFTMTYNLPEAV